jgi:Carboxypeptidase regulatory-like domain
VAGTTLPAGAVSPGPQQLPALSAKVLNSCTGAKVKHLVVSAADPGGAAISPTTTRMGNFVFQSLGPGTYLLSVSAPGYETLSNDSGPGVEVTINPGPPQVPPGTTITQGLTGVIQLAPLSPPPVCSGPGPTQVNALTGIVDSAATGKKVKHLSVSITNPATGAEVNPGPIQRSGEFIQADLDPGTWDLAVAAPNYTGFSGVQVTVNPGPPQDIGTISLGTELGILLPAVQ